MEDNREQSSPEEPNSEWEDYEYLEWVREREIEALEAKLPKKVTFKEMFLTGFFVLLILGVAVYLPFKAITGNEGIHKSHSLWLEDMSAVTELIVAEYVFLGSNQVAGVYFGQEDIIIIERPADSPTLVHELAHAADKHNYFLWETALKEKLYSTFIREQLSSSLLNESTNARDILGELFADAVLFVETGRCGTYFHSLDCYKLAVTTKDFVADHGIELIEIDSEVDYMTPDVIIDGPITKSSNIPHSS